MYRKAISKSKNIQQEIRKFAAKHISDTLLKDDIQPNIKVNINTNQEYSKYMMTQTK